MFSLLAAGFIGFVAVEVLRTHRIGWLAAQLAVSALALLLGTLAFGQGLRRNVSGNLLVARI